MWLNWTRSLAVMGFFFFGSLAPNAMAAPTEIGAAGLKKLMDSTNILVVFPLSPVEFDSLHIPGSVNVPLDGLQTGLPADKDRTLAFYCLGRTCTAAPEAADEATLMGYRHIFVFREGLPGWVAAGYPTKTTATLPEVEIPTLTPAELKALLASKEDFILLDIRSQEKKFRIDDPRSRDLDLNTIKEHWREVPTGKKIVLIDYNGKRTQVAGRYLASKGVKNIIMLSGGMMQWAKEGLPVLRLK